MGKENDTDHPTFAKDEDSVHAAIAITLAKKKASELDAASTEKKLHLRRNNRPPDFKPTDAEVRRSWACLSVLGEVRVWVDNKTPSHVIHDRLLARARSCHEKGIQNHDKAMVQRGAAYASALRGASRASWRRRVARQSVLRARTHSSSQVVTGRRRSA